MFETIKTKLKDLFGHVASIVNARITALVGLATAVIGMVDWSPLVSLVGTNPVFTKTQAITLGVMLFVKGIFDEILRRRNDPTLTIIEAKGGDVNTAAVTADVVQAKKQVKKALEIK
jgi:hypothetical protein